MPKIRDIVTIWICKVAYKVVRFRGGHGAALPGLIAEKINPNLIKKLTLLPDGIIVISGTNGKTTTTHLLAKTLKNSGKKVFTNHSGSNMTRGLLASIIRFSDMWGRLDYDVAVIEVDEAYAAKLAPIINPRAAILTNVLRDQLDRFGEIDYTAKLLEELAKNCSELVVYNATDSRFRNIPLLLKKARPVSYGFTHSLADHFPDDDALYAAESRKTPANIDYSLSQADHDKCTIKTPKADVVIDRSELPGWHNVLNLTAVLALVTELFGVEDPAVLKGLKPPYGRGEVLQVGRCMLTLQLVKNPNGFRTAMGVEPDQPALVIINDQIADGRDVSWLWDVDVSTFTQRPKVSVSGTRAYDMANRLHYSEVACNFVEPNVSLALKKFAAENKSGVVFLTYTAMLNSRTILKTLAKELA